MTRKFFVNGLSQSPNNDWQQKHEHSIPSRILQEKMVKPTNHTSFSTYEILCQVQPNIHPSGIFYGDNPLGHAFSLLLFHLILVYTVTRIARFILKPLKQPNIVSQIIVSFLSYVYSLLLCQFSCSIFSIANESFLFSCLISLLGGCDCWAFISRKK